MHFRGSIELHLPIVVRVVLEKTSEFYVMLRCGVFGLTGRSVHLSPSSANFFFLSSNIGPTNFINLLSFFGLSKIYHETNLIEVSIFLDET